MESFTVMVRKGAEERLAMLDSNCVCVCVCVCGGGRLRREIEG